MILLTVNAIKSVITVENNAVNEIEIINLL